MISRLSESLQRGAWAQFNGLKRKEQSCDAIETSGTLQKLKTVRFNNLREETPYDS
jgi:hypothetical protein